MKIATFIHFHYLEKKKIEWHGQQKYSTLTKTSLIAIEKLFL